MKRYSIAPLKKALIQVLTSNSVTEKQAGILADTMLEADMRGVHTHGVSIFPTYIKKIKNGGFNLTADWVILRQTAAFAVADAQNQFGMVSAKQCMDLAVEQAKTSGIYTVFCRNANTFGPAFRYVKQATDAKMIGICLSNSPSAMPAWGGKQKILGTNPFAVGIPADKESPIIVDMATSIVAKSKINEIRKQGGTIPLGWAVDEKGEPTTDPMEAIRGMIMPMAEHKGYAIAMAIDIIAGVLSGAGYLNRINRFYSEDNACMNVGHCFIAINPELVFDETFCQKIDEYIAEVHASGENVRYPGERGNEKTARCSDGSVELTEETVTALEAVFAQHEIEKALVEYVG